MKLWVLLLGILIFGALMFACGWAWGALAVRRKYGIDLIEEEMDEAQRQAIAQAAHYDPEVRP